MFRPTNGHFSRFNRVRECLGFVNIVGKRYRRAKRSSSGSEKKVGRTIWSRKLDAVFIGASFWLETRSTHTFHK